MDHIKSRAILLHLQEMASTIHGDGRCTAVPSHDRSVQLSYARLEPLHNRLLAQLLMLKA